jgi:hypothetical protein
MSRNFLLAFGGSGARVAEAMAYLCAAGTVRDPLHVLVIDPDHSNGNVKDTLDQLQRYQQIRGALTPTDAERPVFSTGLNDGLTGSSFAWQYPNKTASFESLIDFGIQRREHRDLLSLLFDEGDLEMTFGQGYVGRAHVGSLDMFRTLRNALAEIAAQERQRRENARDAAPGAVGNGGASHAGLRDFIRALMRAAKDGGGANLMVVGSIFGGTGASGLPAIPALLRTTLADYYPHIRRGCLQLTPYFVFGAPAVEGDPSPILHPIATQAALYHYAGSQVGYERAYVLGAPRRRETCSENWPGGAMQRNAAHYVELAGALAAAHFFASPPERGGGMEVAACGTGDLNWQSLPRPEGVRLTHDMAALTTLCYFHSHFSRADIEHERHRGAKWAVDLELRTGSPLSSQDEVLQRLDEFSARFLSWASQVQTSGGDTGELFQVPARPDAPGVGRLVPGGDERASPYHRLHAELNRVRIADQSRPSGWYVQALTAAVERYCAGNYSWWRA